jgi:hypothetical protein
VAAACERDASELLAEAVERLTALARPVRICVAAVPVRRSIGARPARHAPCRCFPIRGRAFPRCGGCLFDFAFENHSVRGHAKPPSGPRRPLPGSPLTLVQVPRVYSRAGRPRPTPADGLCRPAG